MAAATEILGEPGYCDEPEAPSFPRKWQSRRQENLGLKSDTRWLAIWPSTGEPTPAIGLFMQGGFMERRHDDEAARLDVRIWRPATPRTV